MAGKNSESLEYKLILVRLCLREIKSRLKQFYYSYKPASPKHSEVHTCGKKIRILTGSPRSGKTTTAIQDVAWCLFGEHSWIPMKAPNIGWVVVPKFHKIYEAGGMMDKFKAILPANRVEWVVDKKLNIYEARIDNGSVVVFKSQEQGVDSFTSNKVNWILADERIDNHDIRIQLRARIIDENGYLIYTMDKLEDDEWVDELQGLDYVKHFEFEIRDNPYLPKQEMARLEKELDEIDKERIFYGRYKDRDTVNIYPKDIFNEKNFLDIQPGRFDVLHGERIGNEYGNLRVWQEPKPGRQYVMAWDVAEGVGQNSHAIQIFDELGEQAAVWLNNTVDYNRLAQDILIPLGTWYNTALGVGELRSYGYAVMGVMMDHYPNLYVDIQNRKVKQMARASRLRFGVITDEINKPEMVQKLYGDLKEAKLLLHCDKTKKQLLGFIQDIKGKNQTKQGIKYHGTKIKNDPELKNSDDDLVMALLFADRALNAWGYLKPREVGETKIKKIEDIAVLRKTIVDYQKVDPDDAWIRY